MQNYLKIVVAGDVDSGKSTLIGRFLFELDSLALRAVEEIQHTCKKSNINFEFAYLLDSFQEERKNQLTIDTTQAFCRAGKGRGLIFIDVPGHQELIKNMLSGSSYAQIAILVLDAQKPIEPQTKRHAFILQFLGIEQVIVVVNKMDAVNFNEAAFKKIREKTAGLFEKIGLNFKFCIPISAKNGENLSKRSKKIPWYKSHYVLKALHSSAIKNAQLNFRFPIQDIYDFDGEKIAVGKIISGEISKGQKVTIEPAHRKSRIKKIIIFNQEARSAKIPANIGITLTPADILRRGEIICKPELPEVSNKIGAKIFCISPIQINEQLRFRCASQDYPCCLTKIAQAWDSINLEPKPFQAQLKENDIAKVMITAECPVVFEKKDKPSELARFILKNGAGEICAIGRIL